MAASYKESPHSVNGKSADHVSVHTRAAQAALWRLYAEPKPPMWLLSAAFDVSPPIIAKAVKKFGNGGRVPKGHNKHNGHDETLTAKASPQERLAAIVAELGGVTGMLNALAALEAAA